MLLLAVVLLAACPGGDQTSGASTGSTGAAEASPTESSTAPTQTPSEPSPSAEDGSVTDLSGTWSGTWANTTPDQATGTFEIGWDQRGDKLEGTISIEGTPCLSGGEITGRLNGLQIEFGVVSGQVEVAYTGVYDGERGMAGTYSTSCGDAEGTWEATQS